MEKYINDTFKWFDENQNNSNAQELFINKIKEADLFFAPFYANATCKFSSFLFFICLFSFLAETDLTTLNPPRTQIGTPKSGRK